MVNALPILMAMVTVFHRLFSISEGEAPRGGAKSAKEIYAGGARNVVAPACKLWALQAATGRVNGYNVRTGMCALGGALHTGVRTKDGV